MISIIHPPTEMVEFLPANGRRMGGCSLAGGGSERMRRNSSAPCLELCNGLRKCCNGHLGGSGEHQSESSRCGCFAS